MLPENLPGSLYEVLLAEERRDFGGEPFEKLYGEWMRSVLVKMNLTYVSGYSLAGPDYLYQDKDGRLIPCEVKCRAGQMPAISQLLGYINEYKSPFGILVLGGTWHHTWLRHWRAIRQALRDEQLEKILFLLL